MAQISPAVVRTRGAALEINKVLRNTYALLALTLLFSGLTAAASMAMQTTVTTYLFALGGSFLLLWLVLPRFANSAAGVGIVFAITGLLGFGLGPVLSHYLAMSNGPQVVTTAFVGTGAIFLALSGYVLTTRRDFSFLGGFLMVGFVVVLLAALANIFLAIPAMSLALSALIVVIMSGFILFDTSRIINGGETNYIMATVGLYLSIYNIFINLLALLGIAGDD